MKALFPTPFHPECIMFSQHALCSLRTGRPMRYFLTFMHPVPQCMSKWGEQVNSEPIQMHAGNG